jgi:hypothetical protein
MGMVEGQDDASVVGMAVELWWVASTPVEVRAGKSMPMNSSRSGTKLEPRSVRASTCGSTARRTGRSDGAALLALSCGCRMVTKTFLATGAPAVQHALVVNLKFSFLD